MMAGSSGGVVPSPIGSPTQVLRQRFKLVVHHLRIDNGRTIGDEGLDLGWVARE